MLKQVMLMATLLLFVCQVKSEDTDEEIQLICPDGWIAFELNYYNLIYLPVHANQWQTIKNISTCLKCKRNTILEHSFSLVELCFWFWPKITTSNYFLQPEKCNENICNELYYDPFCGMALTLSNQRVTSKKVLPCQSINPVVQNNTLQSVDLICPLSSSFESLFERQITYYNINSFCVLCNYNSATGTSGKPLMITMCSPHFHLEEKKIFLFIYKNLTECQNTNTTICPLDTIPPIQKGLHCGSKFTASRDSDQVNISNYIHCTNGKTEKNLVIIIKS
jgi:hypothetical protein